MLLSAYRRGIFPWYVDGEPILWWSPDPRFVLLPGNLHVPASLRRIIRKRRFEFSIDGDFGAVIRACASIRRRGSEGTWITGDMIDAYEELHRLGYAHSVEAWRDGALVGGLYGVSLGDAFFGESMFSLETGASRAAFVPFALRLEEEGFHMIDSQVYTENVASLGGDEIPRARYLGMLRSCLEAPTRKGNWRTLFEGFPHSIAYGEILQGKGPDNR